MTDLIKSVVAGKEVRQFSPGALQRSIDEAVSLLKPEEHFAVLATADLKGADFIAVGRPKGLGWEHWTFVGKVSKEWKGDWVVSGTARYAI